jgi:dTDP-glucose 4,6-dehydratase
VYRRSIEGIGVKHNYKRMTKEDTNNATDLACGHLCTKCSYHCRSPMDNIYGQEGECPAEPCKCYDCVYKEQLRELTDAQMMAMQIKWAKEEKTKILITGSAGFIFSNFVRKFAINNHKYRFVSVDKLIAPYNYYNILEDHKLHVGDIADEHFMDMVFKIEKPDIVIHGAAESFVDDSIKRASPFITSNVMGTQVIADMCVKYGVKLMYVSTDEVMGQLKTTEDKSWVETDPIAPRNPYSASKAAGELIVKAANQTHGLNYIITRCCNNYGPRQPPRNLVPKVITCILNNRPIPIHGSGKQLREWIHAEDHSSAIMHLIEKGSINEIYNVGTGIEFTNLEIVKKICNILGRGEDLLSFVKDRPGHDFRYSVDCSKLKALGWAPEYNFDDGMKQTVQWYIDNRSYFENV